MSDLKFISQSQMLILNPFFHHHQTNILGLDNNYLDNKDYNLHSTQNLLLIHYIVMVS